MRPVTLVLLGGLAAMPLLAQTPSAEDARFDVVSVRPLPAGSRTTSAPRPASPGSYDTGL